MRRIRDSTQMNMTVLERIYKGIGQIALLIDPEKATNEENLIDLVRKAEFAGIHFFFVGGSTVNRKDMERVVHVIKSNSPIPVLLFPGAGHQLSPEADALLFLNLISGRNPDFLIGHHVQCAEEVLGMDLEVIPTGYILIDGGKLTSVAYVSQTTPIPREKLSIARQTAIAGHLMGQRLLYFDAGSGALMPVPAELIHEIKTTLPTPVIVGGGIRTLESIEAMKEAGANVIVIGNKIEEDLDFLLDIHAYIKNVEC
jgi:phosphoglycerol geranylgeranyltransferase